MALTKAEQLRRQVNKTLKSDVVRMASDESLKMQYQPTGVLPFDILLGGGLPRNRYVILKGSPSTLKSYVGYSAIAACQARGGMAALSEPEHAFDPEWATSIGVDVDRLLMSDCETGEEMIDTAELLIREQVDLWVHDGVAATLPQQEAEVRFKGRNVQPGRQAHMWSAGLRKLTASNSRTSILFTNQLRENIGITFGPTEKMSGGRALGFYAAAIVDIKPTGKVTRTKEVWDGEEFKKTREVVALKFKATLEKSKLNRPYAEVWFTWRDDAIDDLTFLISQGLEYGIIKHSGKTWQYRRVRTVGKDRFRQAMVQYQSELLADVLEVTLPGYHPQVPGSIPARKPKRMKKRAK